jgi:hypothetical protein
VLVFTSYTEGITRHKKTLGDQAVTITGADNAKQRMAAMDAFQKDPSVTVALCNLIAGGVAQSSARDQIIHHHEHRVRCSSASVASDQNHQTVHDFVWRVIVDNCGSPVERTRTLLSQNLPS